MFPLGSCRLLHQLLPFKVFISLSVLDSEDADQCQPNERAVDTIPTTTDNPVEQESAAKQPPVPQEEENKSPRKPSIYPAQCSISSVENPTGCCLAPPSRRQSKSQTPPREEQKVVK